MHGDVEIRMSQICDICRCDCMSNETSDGNDQRQDHQAKEPCDTCPTDATCILMQISGIT